MTYTITAQFLDREEVAEAGTATEALALGRGFEADSASNVVIVSPGGTPWGVSEFSHALLTGRPV